MVYTTDIVRKVAKETRLSQRIVLDTLTAFFSQIRQGLAQGQTIQLTGFGSFATSAHKERTVRHIRTGKPVVIPAHRVAVFRAGELLKQAASTKRRSRRGRRAA